MTSLLIMRVISIYIRHKLTTCCWLHIFHVPAVKLKRPRIPRNNVKPVEKIALLIVLSLSAIMIRETVYLLDTLLQDQSIIHDDKKYPYFTYLPKSSLRLLIQRMNK